MRKRAPIHSLLLIIPFSFILAPLGALFHSRNALSFQSLVSDPAFFPALETSLQTAALTTFCAMLFGVPASFALSRAPRLIRQTLNGFLLIPLIIPSLIGGMAELMLYGPNTPLGAWFSAFGVSLTGSSVGVVLAQLFVASPFLILSVSQAMTEVPKEYLEATQTLGGDSWAYFWHVLLPICKDAIGVGAVLTFARAIGEFGATLMMAYHPYTLPIYAWVSFISGGLAQIVPLSVLLVGLGVLVSLLASFLQRFTRSGLM